MYEIELERKISIYSAIIDKEINNIKSYEISWKNEEAN